MTDESTQTKPETETCSYIDCGKELHPDNMEYVGDGCYVCKGCFEKIENKTGYCSIWCQLGGSCDGSC